MSIFFGLGMNDSPFLSRFIWSFVRGLCFASMTNSQFDSGYGSLIIMLLFTDSSLYPPIGGY